MFGEICKLLDIKKTRTTPLHPQSDGQVERFSRTLIEMLCGKIKEDQKDWDLQLPACMMAYRGAVHESTGVTPNLLMLGRELEVPLDAITKHFLMHHQSGRTMSKLFKRDWPVRMIWLDAI